MSQRVSDSKTNWAFHIFKNVLNKQMEHVQFENDDYLPLCLLNWYNKILYNIKTNNNCTQYKRQREWAVSR